jgi:F-type H+-transporting ATPase subunit epsilon
VSADPRVLQISIISPAGLGYEGAAEAIVAPAHDGQLGILYGHAPMMVLLGEGELRLRERRTMHRFHVARGFLQVVDNEVTVIAEEVRPLEASEAPASAGALEPQPY